MYVRTYKDTRVILQAGSGCGGGEGTEREGDRGGGGGGERVVPAGAARERGGLPDPARPVEDLQDLEGELQREREGEACHVVDALMYVELPNLITHNFSGRAQLELNNAVQPTVITSTCEYFILFVRIACTLRQNLMAPLVV